MSDPSADKERRGSRGLHRARVVLARGTEVVDLRTGLGKKLGRGLVVEEAWCRVQWGKGRAVEPWFWFLWEEGLWGVKRVDCAEWGLEKKQKVDERDLARKQSQPLVGLGKDLKVDRKREEFGVEKRGRRKKNPPGDAGGIN